MGIPLRRNSSSISVRLSAANLVAGQSESYSASNSRQANSIKASRSLSPASWRTSSGMIRVLFFGSAVSCLHLGGHAIITREDTASGISGAHDSNRAANRLRPALTAGPADIIILLSPRHVKITHAGGRRAPSLRSLDGSRPGLGGKGKRFRDTFSFVAFPVSISPASRRASALSAVVR
jgi:hypothetical protein